MKALPQFLTEISDDLDIISPRQVAS